LKDPEVPVASPVKLIVLPVVRVAAEPVTLIPHMPLVPAPPRGAYVAPAEVVVRYPVMDAPAGIVTVPVKVGDAMGEYACAFTNAVVAIFVLSSAVEGVVAVAVAREV
jgi:hypothetical protein